MVRREVISVHLGQAGIQIANALWEIYCIEHCIDPDGNMIESDTIDEFSYETFFERTETDRYVPRALFFDAENMLIDEITAGAYGQLYHPLQLMKGYEDASNNFARGCFSIAKKHLFTVMERLRYIAETCDCLEGFITTHSFGGGTGSGFGAMLSRVIETEYSKSNIIQLGIFPGQILSSSVVEPYNTVLHVEATIESFHLSLMIGNEALYDMSSNLLFRTSPTYTDINRLTALIVSSSLASLRFKGQLNSDLGELQTNLVPYPRVHYPLMRYAPIGNVHSSQNLQSSVMAITRDVFESRYQTIQSNSLYGKFIAVALNYRGNVSQRDVNQAIQFIKNSGSANFVDWCPTGFKIGIINSMQTVVPESGIASASQTVSMLANTTSIKDGWHRICRRYQTLYSKKSFVHWFIDEGMELSEFDQATDNIITLIEDYDECFLTDYELSKLLNRKIRDDEKLSEQTLNVEEIPEKEQKLKHSKKKKHKHDKNLQKIPNSLPKNLQKQIKDDRKDLPSRKKPDEKMKEVLKDRSKSKDKSKSRDKSKENKSKKNQSKPKDSSKSKKHKKSREHETP